MHEVAMAPLSSAIHKSRFFKIGNELADFPRHLKSLVHPQKETRGKPILQERRIQMPRSYSIICLSHHHGRIGAIHRGATLGKRMGQPFREGAKESCQITATGLVPAAAKETEKCGGRLGDENGYAAGTPRTPMNVSRETFIGELEWTGAAQTEGFHRTETRGGGLGG